MKKKIETDIETIQTDMKLDKHFGHRYTDGCFSASVSHYIILFLRSNYQTFEKTHKIDRIPSDNRF